MFQSQGQWIAYVWSSQRGALEGPVHMMGQGEVPPPNVYHHSPTPLQCAGAVLSLRGSSLARREA